MPAITHFTQTPIELDQDPRLTDFEVRLLAYIYTLENTTGAAFPSNTTLAKYFRKSVKTVKNVLTKLYDLQLISSKLYYDETGKMITKRILSTHLENLQGGPDKGTTTDDTIKGPPRPRRKDSNGPVKRAAMVPQTSPINRSINISVNKHCRVVDYLNQKAGKSFKPETVKTKQLIDTRFSEGYTEADFKKVIDIKVKQWGNDPQRNQWLRPQTLFGDKFESYLNTPLTASMVIKHEEQPDYQQQTNQVSSEQLLKAQQQLSKLNSD